MRKDIRKVLVGAAVTGLVLGTSMMAGAAPRPGDDSKSTTKIERHCCKGHNSCRGQGGCGTTAGSNACAGKGNCSTNGKRCTDKKPGQ